MDDARSFIQFCLVWFCVVCHCSLRCTFRVHNSNMSTSILRLGLCTLAIKIYLTKLESNQIFLSLPFFSAMFWHISALTYYLLCEKMNEEKTYEPNVVYYTDHTSVPPQCPVYNA